MHEPLLRGARDDGLRFLQRGGCRGLVTGSDRLFDFARVASHPAAARLVGIGTAGGLAASLLCRFGIGHSVAILTLALRHWPMPESTEERGITSHGL